MCAFERGSVETLLASFKATSERDEEKVAVSSHESCCDEQYGARRPRSRMHHLRTDKGSPFSDQVFEHSQGKERISNVLMFAAQLMRAELKR